MATLMWSDLTVKDDCKFATVVIDGMKYNGVLLYVQDRHGNQTVKLYDSTLAWVAPATPALAAKTKVVLH